MQRLKLLMEFCRIITEFIVLLDVSDLSESVEFPETLRCLS